MVGDKIKVMLVDDDSFSLDMYLHKFEKEDFDVKGYNDPLQALEEIKNGAKPDVLMFDIVMPGLTGWELVDAVREQNLVPNTATIVLSNQGQPVDIEMSKKYQVDGFIIKAMSTPSEVIEKVRKIYSMKNPK
jgi:CheY-like chemotaxis protein